MLVRTVSRCFVRLLGGRVMPRWFSAGGKGTTEVTERPAKDAMNAKEAKLIQNDRFIEVSSSHKEDKEVTVYVKGFLSKGESAERFDRWKNSHEHLVQRLGWGNRMYGYYWQSGTFLEFWNVPLPLATVANTVFHLARNIQHLSKPLLFVPSPQKVAFVALQELSVTAAQMMHQYVAATSHIDVHSHVLAAKLSALNHDFEKIRVVAHSLGCKMVLEALKEMNPKDLPFELHLCAPAIIENDYLEVLPNIAKEKIVLYYCERDLLLSTAFRIIEGNHAVGCVGPQILQHKQGKFIAVDVGEKLDLWVHREYRNRFYTFAV